MRLLYLGSLEIYRYLYFALVRILLLYPSLTPITLVLK